MTWQKSRQWNREWATTEQKLCKIGGGSADCALFRADREAYRRSSGLPTTPRQSRPRRDATSCLKIDVICRSCIFFPMIRPRRSRGRRCGKSVRSGRERRPGTRVSSHPRAAQRYGRCVTCAVSRKALGPIRSSSVASCRRQTPSARRAPITDLDCGFSARFPVTEWCAGPVPRPATSSLPPAPEGRGAQGCCCDRDPRHAESWRLDASEREHLITLYLLPPTPDRRLPT